MKSTFFLPMVVASSAVIFSCGAAWADPLPGEILKFQQLPMIATPIPDSSGLTTTYFGHDELSTAWLVGSQDPTQPPAYSGYFKADDFADRFDTPVVHVRWWGSYPGGQTGHRLAEKFLIAFESDVPRDPGDPWGFSHPGENLLSQVVTKGALEPASGTFTETLVLGSNPAEPVYEYNAELHCPFPQQPDTVYWLKIVALDDNPQHTQGNLWWGWHNRDYTIHDPLASTPPPPLPGVVPGEYVDGFIGPDTPIWHFQDDAVEGGVAVTVNGECDVLLDQWNYFPKTYQNDIDGPVPISQHSMDLAFELYTVPEPGTVAMLAAGLACLLIRAKRRHSTD